MVVTARVEFVRKEKYAMWYWRGLLRGFGQHFTGKEYFEHIGRNALTFFKNKGYKNLES